MKMEHTLTAPIAGTISEISVAAGKQVTERSTIMVVRPLIQSEHQRSTSDMSSRMAPGSS